MTFEIDDGFDVPIDTNNYTFYDEGNYYIGNYQLQTNDLIVLFGFLFLILKLHNTIKSRFIDFMGW